MADNKLYRSRKDRILFGVCGGIAEYFGTDSTLVRVLTVVLFLLNGSFMVLYLLLAIIIPENLSQKKEKPVVKLENNSYLIGAGFVIIGIVLLLREYNIINWSQIWPSLLIMLGVFILWQNQKK